MGGAERESKRERERTAIRKDAGLYCGPRLRKGEVFAYVGLPQNLKDLIGPGVGTLRRPEVGTNIACRQGTRSHPDEYS